MLAQTSLAKSSPCILELKSSQSSLSQPSNPPLYVTRGF